MIKEDDNNSTDQFNSENINYLVDIVKMRTDSLVSYSNRIWTIFNWFQTFNLGIFGIILINHEFLTNQIISLLGISLFISILWVFIGINDFYSFKKHKNIKISLERKLFLNLGIYNEILKEEKCVKKNKTNFLCFNQTKALFIVPVFNIIIILMFVFFKIL